MRTRPPARDAAGGQLFLASRIAEKEKTMRLRIEIRPAEGGQDAELFASELAEAYVKFAAGKG